MALQINVIAIIEVAAMPNDWYSTSSTSICASDSGVLNCHLRLASLKSS